MPKQANPQHAHVPFAHDLEVNPLFDVALAKLSRVPDRVASAGHVLVI